jgi:hypothetical protein
MDNIANRGEVWTDGSGFATVHLPDGLGMEPPLEYELRDLDRPSTARSPRNWRAAASRSRPTNPT